MPADPGEIEAALRRLAGGQGRALRVVYEAWGARAFGLAHHICGDETRARAAVIDGFGQLVAQAGEYGQSGASGERWIVETMRRAALTHRATGSGPPGRLEAGLLTPLDGVQRAALLGAYFMGQTYEDLARESGQEAASCRAEMRAAFAMIEAEFDAGFHEGPNAAPDARSGGPGGALQDDSALAAEAAIGLLPRPEARRFEARCAREAPLRAQAALWSERIAALALAVPPAAAPADLAEELLRAHGRAHRGPFARWMLGAGIGAGLMAMGWFVFLPPGGALAPPSHLARLSGGDETAAYAAYFAADNAVVVEMEGGAAPEGMNLFVWALPAGAPPVPLGPIGIYGRLSAPLPEGLRAGLDGLGLAITEEAKGQDQAAPSGTLRAMGTLTLRAEKSM